MLLFEIPLLFSEEYWINSSVYQYEICVPWLLATLDSRNEFTVSGAGTNTANLTQNWCKRYIYSFLSSCVCIHQVINPRNFAIWPLLQRTILILSLIPVSLNWKNLFWCRAYNLNKEVVKKSYTSFEKTVRDIAKPNVDYSLFYIHVNYCRHMTTNL